MVSSLLSKLANYTNLTQGVREHEEAEDGVRRVTVMVWISSLLINIYNDLYCHFVFKAVDTHFGLSIHSSDPF